MKKLVYYSVLSIILVLFLSHSYKTKMNVITIAFEGKKYDSLTLNIVLDEYKKLSFKGTSKDGKTWVFVYPDSLYNYVSYGGIIAPTGIDTIDNNIAFKNIINKGDTLRGAGYWFNRTSYIKARYMASDIYPGVLYMNEKTQQAGFKTVNADNFLVSSKNSDAEFLASIEASAYSYSVFGGKRSKGYEENIKNYHSITKKHPNSQYLTSSLARNLNKYRSKDDISKIFNCFSEQNKQSYYGKKIEAYINDIFFKNDLVLPTWDTGALQPIIQDSTKYNLILFSASWCAPCHKQIPLLKEIYQVTQGKVAMTYIAMDDPKTLGNWQELMRKENIPWRSILATNNLKEVKESYTALSIPRILLVHPKTLKFEIINSWNADDESKLLERMKAL